MPTFLTIRPYSTDKELERSAERLASVLDSLHIVKRVMTYIFEVPGQGVVTASCFEAPDEATMIKMQQSANLPEAMIRPVRLIRSEGAGTHSKRMTTYVVNRGPVCGPDEVDATRERSDKAEEQMAGELKRMEAWLYDDDDKVAMLSVYQAKNIRAIKKHAKLAGLPIEEIFKARIAS